jgi:hypothetical protein
MSYKMVLLSIALVACSSGDPGSGSDGGASGADASPGQLDAGDDTADAGPVLSSCEGVSDYCSGWNVRSSCSVVDGTVTWSETTCADGCYAGECSATQCADECGLGPGCGLWDMASSQFVGVDSAGSLHDRARDYDRVLRATMLPSGGVANAVYQDMNHTSMQVYNGLIDSAIWTGSELAAQAWRARTTGSADAIAQIRAHVTTLHQWFQIEGDPGYLVRFAAPAGASDPLDVDCSEPREHCDNDWTWLGGISRDQYSGVMLGYMMAYDATPEADVRAMIRDDVVTIARELMKQRTDVPVRLVIDGTPLDVAMDMENVIMGTQDMIDGRVLIDLDTGSVDDASLLGVREFAPDLGPMLRQIPLLQWVPAVPRAGTAVMLGAFFRMAMHMSDDPDIRAYYEQHVDDWLEIADLWDYTGECGRSYYAVHIVYIMAHVWALLEDDPNRRAHVRDGIVDERLWSFAEDHKNPYFAFLWAATRSSPDANVVAAAVAEVAEFEPGPRVHVGRDNLAEYPHHETCTQNGQPLTIESVSVDVDERVLSDFLWQRHPWGLQAFGNPYQTYPGVDYQAAYWAGRVHGYIDEDRAGVCARSM